MQLSKKPGGIQFIAINLFIVFILLNNFHGMLRTWNVRMGKYANFQLPYISNLFYIYGVYGTIQTYNTSYIAIGLPANKGTAASIPASQFIDLKIMDYFPQSHGEVRTRLGFLPIINDPKQMKQKYEWIAGELKITHNKNHPDKPVSQVFIYQYYWPPDSRDYNLRQTEGKLLFLGSK